MSAGFGRPQTLQRDPSDAVDFGTLLANG